MMESGHNQKMGKTGKHMGIKINMVVSFFRVETPQASKHILDIQPTN